MNDRSPNVAAVIDEYLRDKCLVEVETAWHPAYTAELGVSVHATKELA